METTDIPKRLGDFEILHQIGRGGMGVVYEARERSLNRRVALKVLSSGLGLTEKAVMRFRREAEAAAKLHHTNIVPIYSTGEDSGIHFYAMEFIDGPSLDQVIRQLRSSDSQARAEDCARAMGDSGNSEELPAWVSETLTYDKPSSVKPPSTIASAGTIAAKSGSSISSGSAYYDAVARMIAGVADALQHAHDQGVIHRDIKPSNLLLSPDARLSINDFGLARMLEQPGMTISGEFVGSPLYMSPEQITAGRAPLDHRTDIYSLGATLYELLTLQPPYPGRQRDQIIAQILHKEVLPPRRKNKGIPADLETICLKAMDRDPDRRYQTAGGMAEDLRRYVNRHAISAKRVGPFARAAKWARRNKTVSVLILLLLVAVGVAGAFAYKARCEKLARGQEQLEQVKEQTLLSALSGEYQRARDVLEEARKLGAPQGWLLLMEGQVDVLEGHYDRAILKLEQAGSLLEKSTAAYAMLTLAYEWNGDEDKHLARLSFLETLPERDFQDYLLKGWAESRFLPRRAEKTLDEARKLRRSDVATLISAVARRNGAMNSTDSAEGLRLIEKAIADLNAVRTYLPDNPQARAEYVWANAVASDRLNDVGEVEESKSRLDAIREDAEALQDLPVYVDAKCARTAYLMRRRDYPRILEEFEQDVREGRPVNNYIAVLCAALHFQRRDYDKAKRAYLATAGRLRRIGEVFEVYIELATVHDEATRRALTNRFVAHLQDTWSHSLGPDYGFEWTALRLLGESALAEKAAHLHAESAEGLPGVDRWVEIGRFMLGEVNSDQLLDTFRNHREALALSKFVIAIDQLARGDRQGAKLWFENVLTTNYYEIYVHWWSLAFLARVEDSSWLPWLNRADAKPAQ